MVPAPSDAPPVRQPPDYPHVVRRREIQVDNDKIVANPEELKLELFEDVTIHAVADTISGDAQNLRWVGHVAGEPDSHVILVSYKGVFAGHVNHDGGVYELTYTGDGDRYWAEDVRPELLPGCGAKPYRAADELPGGGGGGTAIPPAPPPPPPGPPTPFAAFDGGGTPNIDLMVVWTQAAETAAGGQSAMEALVRLGVTESNEAYANSEITSRLRLVHTERLTYNQDQDDLSMDLDRITLPADGFMDGVHATRTAVGADLVMLITEPTTPNSAGIAWLYQGFDPFDANGFSVLWRAAVSPNYSFAHEIGHNQGCNHDASNAPPVAQRYAPYSIGYRLQTGGTGIFRTVMAYNFGGTQVNSAYRRLWFSSSSATVRFETLPTGSAAEDNARTINETDTTTAGFEPTVRPDLPNLLLPVHNHRFNQTTPTFTFSGTASTGVDYHVQFSSSRLFSSIDFEGRTDTNDTGFSPASTTSPYASGDEIAYTPPVAFPAGTWWWRLRMLDGSGWTPWGEPNSFTHDATLPALPYADYHQTTWDQFRSNHLSNMRSYTNDGGIATIRLVRSVTPEQTPNTGAMTTPLVALADLLLDPNQDYSQWDQLTYEVGHYNNELSTTVEVFDKNDVMVASDTFTASTGASNNYATRTIDLSALAPVPDALYARVSLSGDVVSNNSPWFRILRFEGQSPVTAVTLADLSATAYDGEVLVEWETGSELNNVGFNVYRSTQPDRDFALISDPGGLILGLGDSATGGRYYLLDQTVTNGTTYYYKVEDVEAGRTTLHGPVSATPTGGAGTAVVGAGYVNGQTNNGSFGSQPAEGPDLSQTPEALDYGPGLQISGADGTGFDIVVDVPRFTRGNSGGFDHLTIEGYQDSTELDRPVTPTRNLLIEIPPVVSASLNSVLSVADTNAGYTLPANLVNPGAPPPTVFGAIPPTHDGATAWPAQPLVVNGVLQQGDRTLLSVRVNPISFTANSGEITYRQRIQARVSYGAALPPAPGATTAELTQSQLATSPTVLRIAVSQDGVYRVSQADLVAAGFDVSGDPRTLTLYEQGSPVAIRVVGEDDGALDPGDSLEFFGRGNQTTYTGSPTPRYSDTNVYWLAYGPSASSARVSEVDATHTSALAPLPAFTDRVREEQQSIGRAHPFTEGDDHWFTDLLVGVPTPAGLNQEVTYALAAFAPEPGTATLRYRLRGDTDANHLVDVFFNGVAVDTAVFAGQSQVTREVAVSGVLVGDNAVTLRVMGTTTDVVLVDWVELDHERRFASADRDTLRCGPPSAAPLRLTNFRSPDVEVWGVSDPARPRLLQTSAAVDTGAVEAADGSLSAGVSYAVELDLGGAPAPSALELLAVTAAGKLSPDSLTLQTPTQNLRGPQGADYVIVTHDTLLAPAQRLASYRQGRGLRAQVVTTREIMDEFAGGNLDPHAIRRFLQHAYESWAQPRLKYVVLLGDGHSDVAGYSATAGPNLVPPLMTETEFSWAPCDNRYASVAGADTLPDLHLGRIPVDDVAQADAVIDKIMAYEAQPFDPSWGRRALFVADDADVSDFEAACEDLITRLPTDFRVERAYYPTHGTNLDVRDAIVAALNGDGALMTVYAGHGDPRRWASEDLFNVERFVSPGVYENDLDLLTNAGRPTLLLINNCLSGQFAIPYHDTRITAEAWLAKDGGGAVAVWASSGLTRPVPQELMAAHLQDILWAEEEGVIGDAIVEAKLRLAADGNYSDVIDTWTVFGDPATSLYAEERQVAAPNASTAPVSNPRGLSVGCNLGEGNTPAPALPLALLLGLLAVRRALKP